MRTTTLPPIGTPVRVYRNIRTGLWSVQTRVPGKGWRVTTTAAAVAIQCDGLHRLPGPLARHRAGGKKEVCLMVTGTIVPLPADPCAGTPVRIGPLVPGLAQTPDGRPYQGGGILSFPQGGSCGFLS